MSIPNETTQLERDVLAADDARYAAMLAGDPQELERHLSANLTYMHSTGYRENLAEYMSAIRSGKIRYLAIKRGETQVEQLGDGVAMAQGYVALSVDLNGQERNMNNLFLSIWVLRDKAWRMQAWTSVPRQQLAT